MSNLLKLPLAVAILVFGTSGLSAGNATALQPMAIIERLAVSTFLTAEQKANVELSSSSDLVSYGIIEAKQWICRYTLARQANGTSRLTIPQYNGPAPVTSAAIVELDAVLTNNLLKAIELLLTRNIYPPQSTHDLDLGLDDGRYRSDVIFLRAKGNQGIAGIVRGYNRHANRGELAMAYREFDDAILELGRVPLDERSAVIARLDRDTAIFVQTGHLPNTPMPE